MPVVEPDWNCVLCSVDRGRRAALGPTQHVFRGDDLSPATGKIVQFALESRMDSAEQVACWRRTAQRAGGKLVGDALDAGQLANAAARVRQRL